VVVDAECVIDAFDGERASGVGALCGGPHLDELRQINTDRSQSVDQCFSAWKCPAHAKTSQPIPHHRADATARGFSVDRRARRA
jgi:hypothetical protein